MVGENKSFSVDLGLVRNFQHHLREEKINF